MLHGAVFWPLPVTFSDEVFNRQVLLPLEIENFQRLTPKNAIPKIESLPNLKQASPFAAKKLKYSKANPKNIVSKVTSLPLV